ncbi:MAG: hypothetical protein MUC95_05430 [Spirochaetes bacterium]|nr:hypothetical protein [Spirochaetota bacterium]
MNAKKVNKGILRLFYQHVDETDLYITHNFNECDQGLDDIIKKKYPLIFCGGGDGTVMRIIEQYCLKLRELKKRGKKYSMPKFGILKLGTGNALAGVLGMPGKAEPINLVNRAIDGEMSFKKFNIIESGSRMFHFGGIGIDALVLNDYLDIKKRFSKGFMYRISNTLAGYFAAIFLKSIPKILFRGFKLKVRIVNESSSPVYRVGHSAGIADAGIKKGSVIYEGSADAVIFGTTSDFGYKLKVMPFAFVKPGYFHLRIANTGVFKLLANLRSLWLGTIESPGIHDYLADNIKIYISNPAPLELGGDPEGYVSEIELKVSEFTQEFLSLLKF